MPAPNEYEKLANSLNYFNFEYLKKSSEREDIEVTIAKALKETESNNEKQAVALRIVKKITPEEVISQHFDQELKSARIIENCDHPNIVKINKIIELGKYLIIEMPLYETDLNALVSQNIKSGENTCLPVDLIFMVAYQLANALVYLVGFEIVHRDISLANIFVKQYNKEKGIIEIVLADFEKMVSEEPPMYDSDYDISSGAQITSPPERYSLKLDIWQLGAVIYQMITGDLVTKFRELSPSEKKLKLYGTDSENNIIVDGKKQKRLRNSYLLPYLWTCFQDVDKRIPAKAFMEEILAQFFFYASNSKKTVTMERNEKSKDFFVLNFFQRLASQEDKFQEILEMQSTDMIKTESYIKEVFQSMFTDKGVFNENETISLKECSVYFNKFQGFYLLFTEHFEKAESIFGDVLKINCHDFTSFNNLALVQLSKAKIEQDEMVKGRLVSDAKVNLIKGINNDPFYVSALVNLAIVYEIDKDRENANHYYDIACKYSRISRQKFNSYLNRSIFKAQQLQFEPAHSDLNELSEFESSPIVKATRVLIKWMELMNLPTSHDSIKLENEIVGDFLSSDNDPLLSKSIPYQLYKFMFLFHHKGSINENDLTTMLNLIEETKVQPRILFCSTIVNRFSLHYTDKGSMQTIPMFRGDIRDLVNEINVTKGNFKYSFEDLVNLSRADYKSITLKLRSHQEIL